MKPIFYKLEMGTWKGFVPRGPHRVLLSFNPPFSLILLNLEENKCWSKKGITFWIESF